MTDTPETLMADNAFMGALHSGDAAASDRWMTAHQAMYPEEGVRHPASGPASPSPAVRPSGSPDVAKSAIKAMMADAEAMRKVNSGDEAALRRWNDLHKVAYAEPDQSRGNVPPDGSWYTLPPAPPGAEAVPELEDGFRAAAAAFGLSIDQAGELASSFYQAAELTRFLDDGAMEDMRADSERQLRNEPHTLTAARRVFQRLRLEHPVLADAIQQSGAANRAPFIRLLARVGARHAR